MEKIVAGLVRGRHEMPVSEYIFDKIEDVLDFQKLDDVVDNFLIHRVGIRQADSVAINSAADFAYLCFLGQRELVLYVTGLTAATAAVVKACAINGVKLTLMHFDAKSGEYVPQRIF